MPTGIYERPSIEIRFWSKVDKSGDCWIWLAANQRAGRTGYGRIWRGDRYVYAHRVAWEIANGKAVPEGLFVCHTCDNPLCVKPDHLFVDTPLGNTRDMDGKGRRITVTREGSSNGYAKLTEAQVEAILAAAAEGKSQRVIAREFGVVKSTVGMILRGETWRHVTRPRAEAA